MGRLESLSSQRRYDSSAELAEDADVDDEAKVIVGTELEKDFLPVRCGKQEGVDSTIDPIRAFGKRGGGLAAAQLLALQCSFPPAGKP